MSEYDFKLKNKCLIVLWLKRNEEGFKLNKPISGSFYSFEPSKDYYFIINYDENIDRFMPNRVSIIKGRKGTYIYTNMATCR